MISILHWDSSLKACSVKDRGCLPAKAADVAPDDVWWIDLNDPSPEEEAFILKVFFKVHPLTIEDITRTRTDPEHGSHLPKVEEFPDYLFVIVTPLPPGLGEAIGIRPGGEPIQPISTRLTNQNRPQLSAILDHRVLVTHHYQPLSCVTTARGHLDRHTDSVRRGPDFLFHHILDAMVDEYAPVIDRVAARLDSFESRLFKDPTPKLLGRLLRVKRIVTGLRKTLILEREVLARLIRGEFDLVEEREVVYYRNVYDHLVRYTELIESAREMVSDLMETHLAAVSNRMNQVMKVLTMISTIVLPMTLVAGIYGMNFDNMPLLKWGYGFYFAIALMVALGIVSLWYFRWREWL